MEPHWTFSSPVARHAAAADLWMELTGRKQAAAFEIAKEAMEKRANVPGRGAYFAPVPDRERPPASPEQQQATHRARNGALIGGALGALGAGGASHWLNRTASKSNQISRGMAALGGGTVGAGVGATIGAGITLHKLLHPKPQEGVEKAGSTADSDAQEHRDSARIAGRAGAGAAGGAIVGANLGSAAGWGLASLAKLSDPATDRALKVGLGLGLLGGSVGGGMLGRHMERKRIERERASEKTGSGEGAQVREFIRQHGMDVFEFLRAHPTAASALGATAVGIPSAGAVYLYEKRKHVPGTAGQSAAEIDARTQLENLRAHAENKAAPSVVDRLRLKYHEAKADAMSQARENPRRSAAISAAPAGVLAALLGGAVTPRMLR